MYHLGSRGFNCRRFSGQTRLEKRVQILKTKKYINGDQVLHTSAGGDGIKQNALSTTENSMGDATTNSCSNRPRTLSQTTSKYARIHCRRDPDKHENILGDTDITYFQ